jgi:hypothetical protein
MKAYLRQRRLYKLFINVDGKMKLYFTQVANFKPGFRFRSGIGSGSGSKRLDPDPASHIMNAGP